ncbi:MAG: class I tRNA ligase family protein, partial [Patescibacteria group bacterium]
KMSKSKGNVIDPLDVTETYGTDALRMALLVGNAPGNDLALSEQKIKGYKHFANKIWNVARFVIANVKDTGTLEWPQRLAEQDRKNLQELRALAKEITEDMENFRLYLAAEKLYHYFWHTFADKIIEEAKSRLKAEGAEHEEDRRSAAFTLLEILSTSLKLLHPFMPFITEEIWQNLPKRSDNLLIVEPWPVE